MPALSCLTSLCSAFSVNKETNNGGTQQWSCSSSARYSVSLHLKDPIFCIANTKYLKWNGKFWFSEFSKMSSHCRTFPTRDDSKCSGFLETLRRSFYLHWEDKKRRFSGKTVIWKGLSKFWPPKGSKILVIMNNNVNLFPKEENKRLLICTFVFHFKLEENNYKLQICTFLEGTL